MGATKFPIVPPPQGGTPNLPQPGQPAPMRPEEFAPGSIPNLVSFGFDRVSPPSTLYVQRDDNIRMFAATNIPGGDSVIILLRFLRVPEPRGGQPSEGGVGRTVGTVYAGGIIAAELEIITVVSGVTFTLDKSYAEGYLLSVGARSSNTSQRGRTFISGMLNRLQPGANPVAIPLFSDYVTNTNPAGWPGGRILNSTEGPGFKHSLQVANPGAGADWTFTAGTRQRLRVETLNAVFTAAVAVSNRQVQLILDDGANVLAVFPAAVNIVASTTANVTATSGSVATSIITTDVTIPIPQPLIMEPGWRLRVSTVGIQPADQWSAIWLNVEEWIEGF